MSKYKFRMGDRARIVSLDSEDIDKGYRVGDIVTVDEDDDTPFCLGGHGRHMFRRNQLELVVEDRINWHPHHDVIVAWAKGAKVRGRGRGDPEWKVYWKAGEDVAPEWRFDWEYEAIPEPDHTAEIAEIERKMRELSEDGKRLADQLAQLKGEVK